MNLVIGNTSQLSAYFPNSFERISSRNLTATSFSSTDRYDSVFLTFAEQRTFDASLDESDFIGINVDYTSKIVDLFENKANRIILYGTAELWNNCNGPISIDTKIDYKYSPYVKSKEILWNTIRNKKDSGKWKNVSIIHPFNFNSIHRKEGFLFYKIFDSLINETIHEVGNINIERDIIHPIYLVEKSISCREDIIVGSGKSINVRRFINDIFDRMRMRMEDYIIEKDRSSHHQGNTFWLYSEDIYDRLLEDTVSELNKVKNEKH